MKEDRSISRRGFLKTAAAMGAALTITPTINKVQAAEAVLTGKNGATPALSIPFSNGDAPGA